MKTMQIMQVLATANQREYSNLCIPSEHTNREIITCSCSIFSESMMCKCLLIHIGRFIIGALMDPDHREICALFSHTVLAALTFSFIRAFFQTFWKKLTDTMMTRNCRNIHRQLWVSQNRTITTSLHYYFEVITNITQSFTRNRRYIKVAHLNDCI